MKLKYPYARSQFLAILYCIYIYKFFDIYTTIELFHILFFKVTYVYKSAALRRLPA